MHQTTIRFASDTWARIESQAEIDGTSAAQFVREATLERLARRSPEAVTGHVAIEDSGLQASTARAGADEAREGSEAVWTQAQLARRRAREARDVAHAIHACAAGRSPQ